MEEYRNIIKVHPTVLFKEDLFELENRVIQSFDCSKVDIKITVGVEYQRIEGNSVASILEGITKEYTNELEVIVYGRNPEGNIIRTLNIRMFHGFIDYQIAGNNEVWFLGMIKMLNSFFRFRKPWYSFIKISLHFITGILFIPLGLLLMTGIEKSSYVLSALSIIFLIVLFLIMYMSINEKILPYARIYFIWKNKKKITHETIVSIVSVLTLIATIIGSIILPFIFK